MDPSAILAVISDLRLTVAQREARIAELEALLAQGDTTT